MDFLTGFTKISDALGGIKMKNLVKYDYNMIGGGIVRNETHRLIIGIILLIISIILYQSIDVWTLINASITEEYCENNINKMEISYKVKDVEYKKTVNRNLLVKGADKVIIYYDNTNPNYIKFNNLNYKIIIPILMIGGIYFIASYKKIDNLI